jgi:naphthoate synthase
MANQVSEIFDASAWKDVDGFDALTDITYHRHVSLGAVRVAFNRPEVRNAFRPQTVDELNRVLLHAAEDSQVGVVLLTGNGPSPKDGGWAFSSGGDQRVRGKDGYEYQDGKSSSGRLHILEVQRLIRFMPKVVIALVPGWAAGGGHSLNVIADLSIASREHAMFKQTDATVGSFDAGYGSAYLARQVGQKFAREIFFLADEYNAQRAYEMGVINAVVDHAELEKTGIAWAERILAQSPQSIRMLKYAFNAVDDGLVGQQIFAGEATRLAYGTDEAVEGRDSFLQRRQPDWSAFPWHF